MSCSIAFSVWTSSLSATRSWDAGNVVWHPPRTGARQPAHATLFHPMTTPTTGVPLGAGRGFGRTPGPAAPRDSPTCYRPAAARGFTGCIGRTGFTGGSRGGRCPVRLKFRGCAGGVEDRTGKGAELELNCLAGGAAGDDASVIRFSSVRPVGPVANPHISGQETVR